MEEQQQKNVGKPKKRWLKNLLGNLFVVGILGLVVLLAFDSLISYPGWYKSKLNHVLGQG